MLIDYAINYYCRPGLQVLVLLRMYGCGCTMDATASAQPSTPVDPTLPPGVSRMSVYMLRTSVIGAFLMHVGHTMCPVGYITALTVV